MVEETVAGPFRVSALDPVEDRVMEPAVRWGGQHKEVKEYKVSCG